MNNILSAEELLDLSNILKEDDSKDFLYDDLTSFKEIHKVFVKEIAASLTSFIGQDIDIRLHDVVKIHYGEFLISASNPSSMFFISLDSKRNFIIALSPSIAFPILDKMMGGDGNSPIEMRNYSHIESAVLENLLKYFIDHIMHIWQIRASHIDTSSQVSQNICDDETLVLVTLEINMGAHSGITHICYLTQNDCWDISTIE